MSCRVGGQVGGGRGGAGLRLGPSTQQPPVLLPPCVTHPLLVQELEKVAMSTPEPVPQSGHQEKYEQLLNYYL